MSNESKRLEFLGELAGGLAHEIKNPLSTMRLHLELMQEDVEGLEEDDFSTRTGRKLKLLLGEVVRLEGVVKEFLRVASGHDLKLRATDIETMLAETIEFVRPQAESENVSLHLQVHSDLSTALVDEDYLRAAILNLVQNAINACQPKGGGEVIIEAGRNQNALGISIIDTGVGIADSQRDRVFRAYFTTREEGTGMGLPLARRVIEEHSGYLTFDSVEGQGSRFMILLPVSSGDAVTQIARVSNEFDAGSMPPVNVEAVVNEVLATSRDAGSQNEQSTPKKPSKNEA